MATAQSIEERITVRGIVLDGRQPVERAQVSLTRSTDTVVVQSQRTGPTGEFEFSAVLPGRIVLTVRRIGFSPMAMPFELVAGRDTLVTIRLADSPAALDSVVVTEDGGTTPLRYGPSSRMQTFYERMARGRGHFVTREMLDEAGHTNLQPVLASVPGTKVRTDAYGRVNVWTARCQGSVSQSGSLAVNAGGSEGMTMAVFLNGVETSRASAGDLLAMLKVPDIEAIEVYRSVSELPMEAMGNSCGALFIWTRVGTGRTTAKP